MDKVRTLVTATREFLGVVQDSEHVALAWCVRFAGQIISRKRAFQTASHLEAWGEKIL